MDTKGRSEPWVSWARPLVHAAARHRWMGVPLVIGGVARVAVFAVADVGARLVSYGRFKDLLLIWQHKDANWYLSIVQQGYRFSATGQSSANFFPLYPMMVWLVEPAARLIPSSSSYLLSSLVVSWLAFLAACVLLYRLACDHFDEATARGSVLLMAIFPFSFYYGVPYSESLFLLLALLAFLAMEQGRWWIAAGAAILAGATRPPGIIVGACVALAYGLEWARSHHAWRWDALAPALTPLGTTAFACYCWLRFQDPYAYATTSYAGWNGAHLQTDGIRMVVHLLAHPRAWIRNGDFHVVLYGIYAALLVAFLFSLVPIARSLSMPYTVYAAASIILPVATFSSVNSLGRYLSVVFPTFMLLARSLRERHLLRDLVIVTSAIFLGLFTVLFVSGYDLS